MCRFYSRNAPPWVDLVGRSRSSWHRRNWVKLGDRDMTADWQVFPTSAWNCAIAVRPEDAAESISVTEAPLGQRPFSARPTPVELRVKARKVTSWRAEDGAANRCRQAPSQATSRRNLWRWCPMPRQNFALLLFPNSNLADNNRSEAPEQRPRAATPRAPR